MKLKSLKIANFKAFGKNPQTIPIKPITLVFGPNSAGKSSLIHSLLWLNHVTTRGETDVFHPAISGESVNLGGFQQCLNRKSGEQRLKISLMIETNRSDAVRPADRKIKATNLQLALHFGRVQQGGVPVLEGFILHADQQVLLHGQVWNVENPWIEAKVEWSHPCLEGILPRHLVEEHASFAEYRLHFNGMMPSRIELGGLGGLLLEGKKETLGELYSFFARDFPDGIAEIFCGFNSLIGEIRYLPPLREIPEREMDIRFCKLPGWRWIQKVPGLVNSVNNTLRKMGVQHRLQVRQLVPATFVESAILHSISGPEDLLSAVHSARAKWNLLEPSDIRNWLKQHPALRERFAESWYREISRNGGFWSDYYYDHPECEDETKPPEWWIREESYRQADSEEWMDPGTEQNDSALAVYISEAPEVLKALDATFSDREFKRMTESSVERVEIRLRDESADAWVSLQDVGVGTSQSLPVILEAYGQSNQLIAIEQPELHLHPALQSELGDVFIEAALGPNKNTFLLETHSEHLILRILRRIRETTEGETAGWPEALKEACPNGIRPEDVAVLYVQPGDDGATVTEMPVTTDGDFSKAWPSGFFTERDKELF